MFLHHLGHHLLYRQVGSFWEIDEHQRLANTFLLGGSFCQKFHVVGMFDAAVSGHFLLLFFLLLQLRTVFPEMANCFTLRALGIFIGVNDIGDQASATCGRGGHCGDWNAI